MLNTLSFSPLPKLPTQRKARTIDATCVSKLAPMHTYRASGTATNVRGAAVVLVVEVTLVKGSVDVEKALVVGASVDNDDVEVKSIAY